MNFFGMITFNAPYLPYVLLALTLLLGNSIVVDIMGTPGFTGSRRCRVTVDMTKPK